MVQKLTTAIFVDRAKTVHGNKYDYSKVEYVNNSTKIKIICSDHGEFEQTPSGHLAGRKCIQCGNESRAKKRTKTTEKFINESVSIHGDRYDYSRTKYTGQEKKVEIVCAEHGVFMQKPNVHLMGSGCSKCGLLTISKKKRLSQDDFVARSINVHKDKYDYSLVDYQGSHKNVEIICSEHGLFKQTPSTHLSGGGCPACVGLERYGTDEFIRRASEIHDNKYDYSNAKYINAKTKVKIVCPEHGEFTQSPHHHIKGIGCPGCKADKQGQARLLTQDEFIERALVVHGRKYDYALTIYQSGRSKITVVCPEHGPFKVEARIHIHQGTGCPDCAESGFRVMQPALLYYLRVTTESGAYLYKIGITNRALDDRFSLTDLSRVFPVRIWEYEEGQDALDRETAILRKYKHLAYRGEPVLASGNTELFVSDVLELDTESK